MRSANCSPRSRPAPRPPLGPVWRPEYSAFTRTGSDGRAALRGWHNAEAGHRRPLLGPIDGATGPPRSAATGGEHLGREACPTLERGRTPRACRGTAPRSPRAAGAGNVAGLLPCMGLLIDFAHVVRRASSRRTPCESPRCPGPSASWWRLLAGMRPRPISAWIFATTASPRAISAPSDEDRRALARAGEHAGPPIPKTSLP